MSSSLRSRRTRELARQGEHARGGNWNKEYNQNENLHRHRKSPEEHDIAK